MTVQERNQQIETRFRTVREHLTHANPNDFDRQIPPTFVSCDWEHQTITYAFDMEPRFGNPHGMGHGGIVAAMLDCAQGSAIDCYSTDLLSTAGAAGENAVCESDPAKGRQDAGLLCSGSMAAARSAVRDHGRGVSSVAETSYAEGLMPLPFCGTSPAIPQSAALTAPLHKGV